MGIRLWDMFESGFSGCTIYPACRDSSQSIQRQQGLQEYIRLGTDFNKSLGSAVSPDVSNLSHLSENPT